MPHYEFVCNACQKTFETIVTMAEHDAEKTACPHCGSQEVEQRVRLLCHHLEEERLSERYRGVY